MKRRIIFLVLIIVLVAILPSAALANEYGDEIEYYDVNIKVNENNSYDITETIGINFGSSAHGLERRIPYDLTVYRDINGEVLEKDYVVEVSNFNASDEFSVTKNNGMYYLRLGSESEYVEGLQHYAISYKYDVGDDGISEFDDFYYNIIDTVWDMNINNVTFTITMPKSFDASKIAFQIGETGSGAGDGIEYEVNENVITGKVTKELRDYQGVTVRIELPEGYYTGERIPPNYDFMVFIISIICIAAAVIIAVLFTKVQKPIIPVEFYAPDGMNSADVGCAVDGTADNKDIISLLIYWADKGYLSIEEGESSEDITLIKIKDLEDDKNSYEKVVFEGLFANRDRVKLSSLKYKFHDKIESAKTLLQNKFSTEETNIYTTKSKRRSSISVVIAIVIFIISCVCAVIIGKVELDKAIFITAVGTVALGFYINLAMRNYAVKKSEKTSVKMGRIIGQIIFGIVFFAIYGYGMYLNLNFTGILFLLAVFIMVHTIPMYKQRTEYGLMIYGRILGFKNFINTVEKEKLIMLVEENPSYFYNVLPYAYVLGVTDKWAKNFEGIEIEPPTWYYGNRMHTFSTMYFTSILTRNMMITSNYMTSVQQSKSSGNFTGGGGFGGGFSGGGFGGGGGGRW